MRTRRLAAAASMSLAASAWAGPPGPPGAPAEADRALAHARALLAKHPVADGHNDLAWELRSHRLDPATLDLRQRSPFQTDLPRLRQGGVGLQVWSVWIPPRMGVREQLEQIDLVRRMVARHPGDLALATTAAEAERAMAKGRIASMIGIESGQVIANSLAVLRAYHDLGVRSMTLTHSRSVDWADSSGDAGGHGGLTRFGEEVVREMNRLGMLVDLSHVSDATARAALRVSEAPVVFTHSSARALCGSPRNVPDDVLRAAAANGGIVMVTFAGLFVSDEARAAYEPVYREYFGRVATVEDPAERRRIHDEVFAKLPRVRVTVAQAADHVEHVRRVAGVDHVGLGGDYDGVEGFPEGMEDVSGYPLLLAELVRRGWTDEDLAKLADRNFLRVLRDVEAAGRRLQAARPPSTATIEALDGPRTPPAKAP
jgi:membrane dipeptidase